MRILKKILLAAGGLILAVLVTGVVAAAIENRKADTAFNDYSGVYTAEEYKDPVRISNIGLVRQDISCGYAVIEMFSDWAGGAVTEESLYEEYGKVVTSTGKSFGNEMNKRFPEFKTTMYTYLTNTELLDKVYDSLKDGIPVPVEWTAKYNGEWTLHYSLITGVDVRNDMITVLNPYGYEENITLEEFFERTSFRAYEDMPLFLRLAFAFGVFERNTVFIAERC
jgi:hypothetical protein